MARVTAWPSAIDTPSVRSPSLGDLLDAIKKWDAEEDQYWGLAGVTEHYTLHGLMGNATGILESLNAFSDLRQDFYNDPSSTTSMGLLRDKHPMRNKVTGPPAALARRYQTLVSSFLTC